MISNCIKFFSAHIYVYIPYGAGEQQRKREDVKDLAQHFGMTSSTPSPHFAVSSVSLPSSPLATNSEKSRRYDRQGRIQKSSIDLLILHHF